MKSLYSFLVSLVFIGSANASDHPFKKWLGKYEVIEKRVCRGLTQAEMEEYNRAFDGNLSMDTCVHESDFMSIDVMSLHEFEVVEVRGVYSINLRFSEGTNFSWKMIKQPEPINWDGTPPLTNVGYFKSSSSSAEWAWSGFYGFKKTLLEIQMSPGSDVLRILTEARGHSRSKRAALVFKRK